MGNILWLLRMIGCLHPFLRRQGYAEVPSGVVTTQAIVKLKESEHVKCHVHAGEGHKAAKQRVKEQKLAKVAKVVGVSKLRTKYESAEAKRALCAAYDLFLADERVLPSLPKLLGESAAHASQLLKSYSNFSGPWKGKMPLCCCNQKCPDMGLDGCFC